jgi:hypothetical protein
LREEEMRTDVDVEEAAVEEAAVVGAAMAALVAVAAA